jgi:hypothetical protein
MVLLQPPLLLEESNDLEREEGVAGASLVDGTNEIRGTHAAQTMAKHCRQLREMQSWESKVVRARRIGPSDQELIELL